MTDQHVDTRSDRFRKVMAAADDCFLTRDDRIDLAEYLLRRDIRSWSDLTEDQLLRLLDAFEGHRLINQLIIDGVGRSGRREAVVGDRRGA